MNILEWIKEQASVLAGEEAWIVQIFIIVFITLLLDFVQKRVLRRVLHKLRATETIWDDALIYSIRTPLTILIWVLGLSFALDIINFAYTNAIRELGIIITISWALVRFIKVTEEALLQRKDLIGEKIDRTTADAIAQLLRISVVITAVLVGLQSLGVNISAILAFGGISGIAVGFAAKDLLANFFGGLMIYLDRPFAVGDWVRSPERNIEGTVERIGWRLTIIRTFDKRPLYIPNSVIATVAVENPSRMSHRRIYETVGVRYDDLAKLPAIVDDVKDMLLRHPDIAIDQTLIVNFNSFASSSLDFFIYTFTKTINWVEYHKVKQDVLFKISDIIAKHGAEIAFPTSTVHIPDGLQIQANSNLTNYA